MSRFFKNKIDWILLFLVLPIAVAGLLSINSFDQENILFLKQSLWLFISCVVLFTLSFFDFRFLRNARFVMLLYFLSVFSLLGIFLWGSVFSGAQSWFDLGFFAVQPSDFAKLVLILVLAKYFSKRHVAIEHFRHIFISGAYTFILFFLVVLQPDFGSAIIIFLIWFGMILISGVSKKHLFFLIFSAGVSLFLLWNFVFLDYQKDRIITFFYPKADISGAGYNANQAKIAIGSGQVLGKGIGYGTQSRLAFLPESKTDFIFSSFAEEWGFLGVCILFLLYFLLILRIAFEATLGESNFETLFFLGVSIYFLAHIFIHISINIGFLPVTGTTIPFMSYGGSHLLTEFIALGILMGMRRYQRPVHRESLR